MKIIELKDIRKVYFLGAAEVAALDGISLAIYEGEFVAIMGASGSGKSTLLHILGLLDKPTSGSYRLAGMEVSNLSDAELATFRNKFLGFIFQSFNLLPRVTALGNVALPKIYSGAKNDTDEAVLLRKVGLGDRIYHKPNELSGGQQQRVAIARSLVNNPLLIFADEPTGNLDTKSALEIIGILKELNASGITIVMVTHEPNLAQAASRMIRLQDGVVVSDETRRAASAAVTARKISISGHNEFNSRRIGSYFVQALRSLASNKTRSALSILGVLIGVTSVIAMLALGTGAQDDVKKRISSLGSNLLTVRAASARMGGIAMEGGSQIRLTLEDIAEIREKVDGVEKIAGHVSGRGQVVYGGKNWNTSIDGTTADYPVIRNAVPEYGRFFDDNECATRAKVAVVGQTIVRELFGGKNPIGEFIKIKRIDFQVIGVLPTKGASGWRDEDDIIEVPLNTAMYRLLGKENVDNIEVQVKEQGMMDNVSDNIKKLLLSLHRQPASKTELIDARNMADIQQTITATTKTFTFLLGSIAFISLLVGGIGIMNIMLVSVTERTREIGLRKSIGADNRDILFQFIIESIVICLLGGILGILLGSVISLSLAKFAGWSTKISLSSVMLSFTFSALIGLVFGIWPARKAAALNPIDALRYE